MAEVTFDVKPTTPQKRSYDGEPLSNQTPTVPLTSSNLLSVPDAVRQGSPALSTDSSLTELSALDGASSGHPGTPGSTAARPAKKRKLGFLEKQAEKAAKEKEKADKERIKAEEKQRKLEEKAAKDEEKRRKAEEKEAERRVKEIEKAKKAEEKKAKEAAKEAVKQKEEEEKQKKERAQMRLGAFFAKPKEATPPSTPDNVSEGALSRRSSIASIKSEKNIDLHPPTPQRSTPQKTTARAEFDKWMLPFYVLEHTDIAPYNRFRNGKNVDFSLSSDGQKRQVTGQFKQRPRTRARKTIAVKDIVKNLQESGVAPDQDSIISHALQHTPYKVLHFREDVRPPYQGTYTRPVSSTATHKLARNPFTRQLPDTNYDYDSEAEWEPPGEDDEDLGDDDDEISNADDVEDEMADFLDDENDIVRKKGPTTNQDPISSGICWENEAYDDNGMNLIQYRMDFLHDSTKYPINPFSTVHWIDESKPKPVVTTQTMQPPAQRQPLSSLSPNASGSSKTTLGVDGKPIFTAPAKSTVTNSKPTRLIATELMPDFKRAIEGSQLTKTGLIEVLKTQFKQCPKDAIKSTLEAVAKREGKKEVDKKWVIIDV